MTTSKNRALEELERLFNLKKPPVSTDFVKTIIAMFEKELNVFNLRRKRNTSTK